MVPRIVLQTADGRQHVLERSPRSFFLPGVISALMTDELTIAVFTYLLFPICRRWVRPKSRTVPSLGLFMSNLPSFWLLV